MTFMEAEGGRSDLEINLRQITPPLVVGRKDLLFCCFTLINVRIFRKLTSRKYLEVERRGTGRGVDKVFIKKKIRMHKKNVWSRSKDIFDCNTTI